MVALHSQVFPVFALCELQILKLPHTNLRPEQTSCLGQKQVWFLERRKLPTGSAFGRGYCVPKYPFEKRMIHIIQHKLTLPILHDWLPADL